MTTSNQIVTQTFDSVLSIPIEAVHSNDSMTYVFTNNNTKQVVVLGEANENKIIVEAGLAEGDLVLLTLPEQAEELKWAGLELVEVLRQKEAEEIRLQEEQQQRMEELARQRQQNGRGVRAGSPAGANGTFQMPPGGGGGDRGGLGGRPDFN